MCKPGDAVLESRVTESARPSRNDDREQTTAGCELHNRSGMERPVGAMKSVAFYEWRGKDGV